jgi:hypothetical protein
MFCQLLIGPLAGMQVIERFARAESAETTPGLVKAYALNLKVWFCCEFLCVCKATGQSIAN